jgi:hypothetical protein
MLVHQRRTKEVEVVEVEEDEEAEMDLMVSKWHYQLLTQFHLLSLVSGFLKF